MLMEAHNNYDGYCSLVFTQNEEDEEDILMHAVPGFFLVCTSDGKLVYISPNVTDFLGHSTVNI